MTVLLASNQGTTTLGAPLLSSGTVITVAVDTGGVFPSPAAGQGFTVTLSDAATSLIREICLCTARTNNQLTVLRAQEGTIALNWATGDIVSNLITSSLVNNYTVQPDTLQNSKFTYAAATGTPDAILVTITSMLTAINDGMAFSFRAIFANTTNTPTLQLTLGSTQESAITIVKMDNQALLTGDIQPDMICNMVYNNQYSKWVLLNPINSAAGGSF